jgi:hypothetical protein
MACRSADCTNREIADAKKVRDLIRDEDRDEAATYSGDVVL